MTALPGDGVPDEWVAFAGALADAAGAAILPHYRTQIAVDTKNDESPVTAADREAEAAMRAAIEGRFPDHGIRGEEFEDRNPGAEAVWVLDPIDGTRSFMTGKPVFTTLVALLNHGEAVLGVIDQPVTRERWVGAKGRATTWNGSAQHVRPCPDLGGAALYTTGTEWYGPAELEAFSRLRDAVRMTMFSADAYAFGLLASGQIDLAVECNVQPHDFCALVPVVTGSGGIITDWEGNALQTDRPSRVLAAGDPAVHRLAMSILGGAQVLP